jgi:hypothetical protein
MRSATAKLTLLLIVLSKRVCYEGHVQTTVARSNDNAVLQGRLDVKVQDRSFAQQMSQHAHDAAFGYAVAEPR